MYWALALCQATAEPWQASSRLFFTQPPRGGGEPPLTDKNTEARRGRWICSEALSQGEGSTWTVAWALTPVRRGVGSRPAGTARPESQTARILASPYTFWIRVWILTRPPGNSHTRSTATHTAVNCHRKCKNVQKTHQNVNSDGDSTTDFNFLIYTFLYFANSFNEHIFHL